MAKSIMNPSTLFGRLRQLRSTVKAARTELETLRDSMNRQSKPGLSAREGLRLGLDRQHLQALTLGGWKPAEDLHLQLGNALADLDSALDYMKPMTLHHVDQPVEAQERAHV